jgi:uncharacterized repeat protein (TIGR03803 family)
MMRRDRTGIRELLFAGLLFSGTAIAQTFGVLHVFDNSTENPTAPLLAASDGNLYLPTYGGGTGLGAIYRLTPDGSGGFSCALIHEFSGSDGAYPSGGLVEGAGGLMYGTTGQGGAEGQGVVYRISTGGDFAVLRSLAPEDTAFPFGELVLAPDGKFYGTSAVGGVAGSIYRFDPDGDPFEVVYFFGNLTGSNPQSGLLLGSDGMLYGMTPNGGGEGYGSLFRVGTDGSFELLHTFSASDTNRGYGVLAELDGSIYGAVHGDFNYGAIFRWNATDGFANVHLFTGPEGSRPEGGMIASGGFLYGTTAYGGTDFDGNIFRSDAEGNVTSLHDFNNLDGGRPKAHPTRAGSAWVGTTQTGGSGFSGTVYQLPDAGALTTVCAFGQGVGYEPYGTLFEASDGNFYGTTRYGGQYYDLGTVFRLGKDGQVFTLHSFQSLEGRHPSGGLVQGSDGALFGITADGGANNEGVAYRLDFDGNFSLLHTFTFQDDTGYYPSPLAVGPDGELYGPTAEGGDCGLGVIYRMAVNGTIENLHDNCASASGPLLSASDGFLYGIQGGSLLFRFSTDGTLTPIGTPAFPYPTSITPGLTEGPDHNLYGTSGNGLLFRFRPDGGTSILHTFSATPSAPAFPSSLVTGTDGRLYGTSFNGTGDDPGTVFRISTHGDFEVLHVFDAGDPQALSGVIEASDGDLYGLASRNTIYGRGLAYRIDLGTLVNRITPSS